MCHLSLGGQKAHTPHTSPTLEISLKMLGGGGATIHPHPKEPEIPLSHKFIVIHFWSRLLALGSLTSSVFDLHWTSPIGASQSSE